MLLQGSFLWRILKCADIHDILYTLTDMVSSQLELHRYATGRESRVVTALTLLKSHLLKVYIFSLNTKYIPVIIDLFILCRYQGHVSAALVLGGYDTTGPHLHTVSCVSKSYLGWSLNIFSLNIITSWSNICRFIPMALLILSHLQQWGLDP